MLQQGNTLHAETSQHQVQNFSTTSTVPDQNLQKQLEGHNNHFDPLIVSVQSTTDPCNISPNPQEVPSTPSPISSDSSGQSEASDSRTQYHSLPYTHLPSYPPPPSSSPSY